MKRTTGGTRADRHPLDAITKKAPTGLAPRRHERLLAGRAHLPRGRFVLSYAVAAARFAVALIKPFNRNAWELGQFFVESLAGSRQTDFVLSAYGQDTLEEYFRQRYQQAES